ncbi:hypothetical protein GCM10029976_071740 [Kribbella albertanoniae]|uniref:SnoaL-like domain-containing protein n=1 Tax=Kribbella albertanoniae TaxID=1266829 RepID=A0A4R4P3J3_9ACTN|nr:nuclear transport factor 2 family protein [Kribbella albertanoniae]TDC15313.1 hypothetical protein E1261_40645 [Kribbella albertanoniae]
MSHTDTFTRMLFAVDALDWATIRAAFADNVRVDYTELFGGEAEEISGDELVARWQGLLPGFEATQHLTGPYVVDAEADGAAVLQTHVRGYHYIAGADGGPVWAVNGHYVARFEDGRISALTLQLFYQEGNTDLPALATTRAVAGRARRK